MLFYVAKGCNSFLQGVLYLFTGGRYVAELSSHLSSHLSSQSRFPVKKYPEWHKKEPPSAVMRQTALVLSVYAALGSVFGAFVVCLVLWRSAPLMMFLSVVRSEGSQKPSNRVIIGT